MAINTLPPWLDVMLKCPECQHSELERESDAFRCTACDAHYPIVNRVPMLLKPSTMVDAAKVISSQLSGIDPEAVQLAFGTALRYRLHDRTLRDEFTQIVERYAKVFDAYEARNPTVEKPQSFSLITEYFNKTFVAGNKTYRSFRFTNNTNMRLATTGDKPFNLSYKLIDPSGREIEGLRSSFPVPLLPGRTMTIPLCIEAPLICGEYHIRVLIVQEFVGWYERMPIYDGTMVVMPAEEAERRLVTPPHSGYFDFDEDLAQCGRILQRAIAMIRAESHEVDDVAVLEMACGNDPQTLRHYQNGTNVVACDLAFPQVQLGSLAHDKRGDVETNRYAFTAADVFNAPFRPRSFHIVVVCAALHHFSDIVAALQSLRTLLVIGGKLVLLREPGKVFPEDETYINELANGFNEQQFELAEYRTMFERSELSIRYHQLDFECSYKVILE